MESEAYHEAVLKSLVKRYEECNVLAESGYDAS
jgi:hypothetical protein